MCNCNAQNETFVSSDLGIPCSEIKVAYKIGHVRHVVRPVHSSPRPGSRSPAWACVMPPSSPRTSRWSWPATTGAPCTPGGAGACHPHCSGVWGCCFGPAECGCGLGRCDLERDGDPDGNDYYLQLYVSFFCPHGLLR